MQNKPKIRNIRQVFLDMDGTIYHGNTLFSSTKPFLHFLQERQINYAFLSNNSSYSTTQYIDKLQKMGLTVTADKFYVSTDYLIDYLRLNYPSYKKIFLLGVAGIRPIFEAEGFTLVEDHPDAVAVAFDRELTYERLCRAAYFIKQGVPGFATHPDPFCPTDQPTFLPDCGALTACLETATGSRLSVLGKPDPGMLQAAAKRYKVAINGCLMIGDRLATDIAAGVNAGCATCRITGPGSDQTDVAGIVPDWSFDDLWQLQIFWQKSEAEESHENL